MSNAEIKIAVVVSKFNEEITEGLLAGTLSHLQQSEVNNVEVIKVPGAGEIPLVAKLLAKTKKFDAIICLGAVIRGETTHYDYVCQQVSRSCQQVMLEVEIPIIFGVLTTENEQQALDRIGGNHGHKGVDAAQAALEMIGVVKRIC